MELNQFSAINRSKRGAVNHEEQSITHIKINKNASRQQYMKRKRKNKNTVENLPLKKNLEAFFFWFLVTSSTQNRLLWFLSVPSPFPLSLSAETATSPAPLPAKSISSQARRHPLPLFFFIFQLAILLVTENTLPSF